MNKKQKLSLLAMAAGLISATSSAIAEPCTAQQTSTVHLTYIEKIDSVDAGTLVKQYTDRLRDITKSSAFTNTSPIAEYVSLQKPADGEQQDIVISLSLNFTHSYDAISQLVTSKDYLSLDISTENSLCP
ncbi:MULTISPECIES: hypothetical protein [Corallincola]|uniref:Uncharacterized protein n=3 Tax=Corallincola TaxID=1775176 RepID=A0A368NN71_9GAMM|nr:MULTISPECIES: hypothetical protein [Corallincola]RCU51104.1 hypothetical protein DU002_07260 [Corallincola holothuriorum]TAA46035.1 hypothetical protein EXY25_11885 [Corallincola spongiicola]TCI01400.1 hypothetical protein EZV61_17875 [Corallincola luteus]